MCLHGNIPCPGKTHCKGKDTRSGTGHANKIHSGRCYSSTLRSNLPPTNLRQRRRRTSSGIRPLRLLTRPALQIRNVSFGENNFGEKEAHLETAVSFVIAPERLFVFRKDSTIF